MWNAFFQWLTDKSPLMLLIVVVAVIVWLIAKFYYKRFKILEERVETLPCDKHEDTFTQIKEELLQIKTFLMTKNPKTASLFSVKQSPRELNKAGKEVFAEINGEDFLQTNSEKLLNAIARKQPRTALDVEISANEVLIEFVNTDMFNDLKKWVYNSPTKKMLIDGQEKDYAFTIADVCFILSLPLRDKYLSLHPEIK